jgi:hypothetical protein
MTTPTPADMATAKRLIDSVFAQFPHLVTSASVVAAQMTAKVFAAALAEQRDAEFAVLRDIEQSADDSCIEADVECCGRLESIRRTVRERMAALTGGPTEKNS